MFTSALVFHRCALSVKMNVLLYVPGVLVVLFQRRGLLPTFLHILLLAATQAIAGLPFLLLHPRSYLGSAYEFSRIFLFKWTVNWRFLGESLFLSPMWARGLLATHLGVLVLFGFGRWCRAQGGVWSVLDRGFRAPLHAPVVGRLSADCE